MLHCLVFVTHAQNNAIGMTLYGQTGNEQDGELESESKDTVRGDSVITKMCSADNNFSKLVVLVALFGFTSIVVANTGLE